MPNIVNPAVSLRGGSGGGYTHYISMHGNMSDNRPFVVCLEYKSNIATPFQNAAAFYNELITNGFTGEGGATNSFPLPATGEVNSTYVINAIFAASNIEAFGFSAINVGTWTTAEPSSLSFHDYVV